jgi:hypothetical protein
VSNPPCEHTYDPSSNPARYVKPPISVGRDVAARPPDWSFSHSHCDRMQVNTFFKISRQVLIAPIHCSIFIEAISNGIL